MGGRHFNSRPSARGDTLCRDSRNTLTYFNSRPSARGDALKWTDTLEIKLFQFTPLREGRHDALQQVEASGVISIHAPPRGATLSTMEKALEAFISIHAPPRGATPPRARKYHRCNFNSRPSARGDVLRHGTSLPLRISIHAPPRGATRARFQYSVSYGLFQFTPLREGRPSFRACARLDLNFNSRPSARGDTRRVTASLSGSRFQFTPLREGRRTLIS